MAPLQFELLHTNGSEETCLRRADARASICIGINQRNLATPATQIRTPKHTHTHTSANTFTDMVASARWDKMGMILEREPENGFW